MINYQIYLMDVTYMYMKSETLFLPRFSFFKRRIWELAIFLGKCCFLDFLHHFSYRHLIIDNSMCQNWLGKCFKFDISYYLVTCSCSSRTWFVNKSYSWTDKVDSKFCYFKLFRNSKYACQQLLLLYIKGPRLNSHHPEF